MPAEYYERSMSPRRPENPPLDREHLAADPLEQFARWFAEADAEILLGEAMTLATVDGRSPDARVVLLKGFGPEGFRFFTNYESAKGRELEANPRAALVLYWAQLDRQIRIRGTVERLPASDSDVYFASRPRDSQIGAAVSPQSRPIERDQLDRAYRELVEEIGMVMSPAGRLGRLPRCPDAIEFWQGARAACTIGFCTRGSRAAAGGSSAWLRRRNRLARDGGDGSGPDACPSDELDSRSTRAPRSGPGRSRGASVC
jgi:pyridoxamine 5'-phosphate oxidase